MSQRHFLRTLTDGELVERWSTAVVECLTSLRDGDALRWNAAADRYQRELSRRHRTYREPGCVCERCFVPFDFPAAT